MYCTFSGEIISDPVYKQTKTQKLYCETTILAYNTIRDRKPYELKCFAYDDLAKSFFEQCKLGDVVEINAYYQQKSIGDGIVPYFIMYDFAIILQKHITTNNKFIDIGKE